MDFATASFERGSELARNVSALPVASYNLSRVLMAQRRIQGESQTARKGAQLRYSALIFT
jgi:hypothetical protein